MNFNNWYAIQVFALCEKKVLADLRERRSVLGDSHIINIEVPEKTEMVYTKAGVRKAVKSLLLPGYVLLQIIKEQIEEEDGSISYVFPGISHDIIRSTPNVIGFAGQDKRIPRVMSPKEIKNIFSLVDDKFNEVKKNLLQDYYPGDSIEIIEGPFIGKSVVICDIVGDKIITTVNFCNSPTRVELSKQQVYKK